MRQIEVLKLLRCLTARTVVAQPQLGQAGALTTFLCLHYSCFRQIFLRRGRRCK